jgi:fructokinase
MTPIYAGVEGGGTTFVVALAKGSPTNLVERAEFPTTTPEETLRCCCDWLSARQYDALGVACFGPIDLQPQSPTYGFITTTPKPGWKNVDVLGPLRAVNPTVPFAFDTDVNAPALAEHVLAVSEAQSHGAPTPSSCCYITVGTGIGVGLVINGAPVHGLMHPEGGHVCVPRRAADAGFEGPNPTDTFGGLCAENMSCSVALALRGSLASTSALAALPDDDPLWDAAAHYLGALCANVVLLASPERIIMSGGVMQRASLFPRVRERMRDFLNGYVQLDALTTDDGLCRYVVPSAWGNSAGMVGALTLAAKALEGAGGAQGAAAQRPRRGPAWARALGVLAVVAAVASAVVVKLERGRR